MTDNDLLFFNGSPRDVRGIASDVGLSIDLFQPFRDFEGVSGEQLAPRSLVCAGDRDGRGYGGGRPRRIIRGHPLSWPYRPQRTRDSGGSLARWQSDLFYRRHRRKHLRLRHMAGDSMVCDKDHLERVDHIAQALPEGRLDAWVLFYRTLLGLETEGVVDLPDPYGLMRSKTMSNRERTVRFPLNISESRNTTTARSVTNFAGAGVSHIAFSTSDIFTSAEAVEQAGGTILPIPSNCYEDVAARFELPTSNWTECDDSIFYMIAWELENSSSSIRCRWNRDSFLRLYNEADPMIFTAPRTRPCDWQRWRIITEASRRSFLEEDRTIVGDRNAAAVRGCEGVSIPH